jgi:lysophospholipase L1-like esterase
MPGYRVRPPHARWQTRVGSVRGKEVGVRWRRYVAVGDSFTEGMNDLRPDGTFRGWADLVAAGLTAEHARLAVDGARAEASAADFGYANLAIRGRLFHAIVDEQVPVALALKPDLVSFAGGGNDVLRPGFDPVAMMVRFDQVIRDFRATGADVVIFRWANVTSRLPGRRMILPRMEILNRAVEDVTARHGAIMVDMWGDDEFHNPRLWSDDRLHLAPVGHRRVAAHVLTALGVAPNQSWFDSPGPPARRTWVAARARDAQWAVRYLAPWVKRRLTGRSSGDSVTAKRPSLGPILD